MRKRLVILGLGVACIGGASAMCIHRGRQSGFVASWNRVSVGMSRSDVLRLLGEPTLKTEPGGAKIEHEGDSEPTIAAAGGIGFAIFGSPDERWEYSLENEGDLSEAEIAEDMVAGLFGPSDNAYVVYFDAAGKVKALRPPVESADARPSDNQSMHQTQPHDPEGDKVEEQTRGRGLRR